MKTKKRIALVAHDNRKKDLIKWVEYNVTILSHHKLFATGTTGNTIEKVSGLKINKLISGPLGGDQQLGALIAQKLLDILIFFWDPMTAQPHDVDVKALLRIAVMYNIPIACNNPPQILLSQVNFLKINTPQNLEIIVNIFIEKYNPFYARI